MDLTNKKIIITGSGSGIGLATTNLVLAQGAIVAAFDIKNKTNLDSVVQDKNGSGVIRYWQVDIRNSESVKKAVISAVKWFGGEVDVLLNIAGVLMGASIDLPEFPDEIWDEVIDINLKGSYLMCKAVSHYMIKSESGVIVLCSSGAGVSGGSSSFAYGTSKGGTHGLAMVMEYRLRKFGIRVNDVCPGSIETPLKVKQLEQTYKKTGNKQDYVRDSKRLLKPDGVASVFAFLASDDARYVRGTIFTR